ncbi:MAG: methyltransferase domain-containing protein [Verrucomicrobiae bacterium]|nr:methyltransferase domain-containing protein [Verrucomicrobiae bacterium]
MSRLEKGFYSTTSTSSGHANSGQAGSGQPLKGLDAGCGAGARDLDMLCSRGFDAMGLDSVAENIRLSCERKPHLASRLFVHDLREALRLPDAAFDFVLCGYVIQHTSKRAQSFLSSSASAPCFLQSSLMVSASIALIWSFPRSCKH